MDEPGSAPRRGSGDHDGEEIHFGGLPIEWHLPEVRLLSGLRHRILPPRTALIALAVGLLAGFAAGHFATHSAGQKATAPPASTPVAEPLFVGPALSFTGERCAVQVGKDLQLGIEVLNGGNRAITLGLIGTKFPMGGLRSISGGVGACGTLPEIVPVQPSLSPGGTEWLVATVGVLVPCPEALPVWFTVQYSIAGKTTSAVLAAFPDLGPVAYRHCLRNIEPNTSSPTVAIVDPASGRSYGG